MTIKDNKISCLKLGILNASTKLVIRLFLLSVTLGLVSFNVKTASNNAIDDNNAAAIGGKNTLGFCGSGPAKIPPIAGPNIKPKPNDVLLSD